MSDLSRETLELCRQTIDAHVKAALSMARIAHFNTDKPGRRPHEAVVEARWRIIESLIFAEEQRIEAAERADVQHDGMPA